MNNKTVWEYSKLKWLKWVCLLALLGFLACYVSLLIHPERPGFVFAVIFSLVSTILFFYDFAQTKATEYMVEYILQSGKYTSELTVMDFEVNDKNLISIELFNGELSNLKLAFRKVSINVYEVPGVYCIIHEFSDIPFTTKNIVRVFKKA